jgi:hypothetical protein
VAAVERGVGPGEPPEVAVWLGFGRIVVSGVEIMNLFVNRTKWMSGSPKWQSERTLGAAGGRRGARHQTGAAARRAARGAGAIAPPTLFHHTTLRREGIL